MSTISNSYLKAGNKMIIEKKILFEGSKGELELNAMFDSGASFSCIKHMHAVKLGDTIKLRRSLRVGTASEHSFSDIYEKILLDFYIDNYRFFDDFIIVPELSKEIIIGAATMQKWRFKLDFEKDEVIIDPRVTKFRLL